MQRAIAAIWAEVLEVDEVGLDEDFFELGGDSLAAVRMLAAVNELLLAQVDFGDFVEAPTIAAVAEMVQRTRDDGVHRDEPPEVGLANGVAPCTFAQERLWFLDQLADGTGSYNETVAARIRGPIDGDSLESSLQQILRRHGALRTSFAIKEGVPVQIVAEDATLELRRIDLKDKDPAGDELQRLTAELAARPFDLTVAPLVRAALLRVATDDHVLQLVFHHNVTDGSSHVIVLDELAELYRASREGREPALGDAPAQYPDHARRQRERLSDEVLERVIAPWRVRLAGIPAALDLPTDHPRPPAPSYRGEGRRTRIGGSTSGQIRAFCRAERVTPFATMFAAFAALLARYSGQETVVLGSATAGRDRPELQRAVGLFANTIVLRADLSGDPSFRELLDRVGLTIGDAVAHQDAPFERLVAELQTEPDLSRHPIFQVMMSHRPHARLRLEGAEPFDVATRTSRADLTLWIEEAPDGWELLWEYSTDLFESRTIERMERHYLCLLRAAIAAPRTPAWRLPMLEEPEREQLLRETMPVRPACPVACMHTLFEHQAAVRPEAIALTFEGESLTYQELNERANRLAHRLCELGIGEESLVALFLERSIELVVSILAVLKAGGAYVPLDPAYPQARIGFVLADTAPSLLLTQRRLVEQLPEHGATAVCVDGDEAELPDQSSSNPALTIATDSLAYVIYTSGSTGQPKGVQVEHRQVARLFSATDGWYGFDASDSWVMLHSYAFDVSVWELWGALAHGGRLVLAPAWTTRSPPQLAALIADERVTVLSATPSLFGAIQEELLAHSADLALRYVVFGGEALRPPTLRSWFDRFGDDGPRLVNMYGITETTVHATYRPIDAADCEHELSPVGVPIPDLAIYLLDRFGEPVAPGVPGEVCVGGAGVTRGYLNRPELTAERFVANPFGPGRLYRSGDVARRMPDGELAFLGRMDDQVKIRGFRIELGEIQSVLGEHEAVADNVVLAIKSPAGDVRLAAYVVPDDERAGAVRATARVEHHDRLDPDRQLIAELESLLERRLPSYMVPSSITVLDELPLTTHGKLDRRALPAPLWERRETDFIAPRTDTERRVAAIWQQALGVQRVGAQDNFFRLGGHSLLAARVTGEVRELLRVALSVRVLFERPLLADFAAHIDSLGSVSAAAVSTSPASDDELAQAAPLSFQQQSLIFFEALDPGSTVYNAPLAIRIRGELDVNALRVATGQLVARQDALRTVIAYDGEDARQSVLDRFELELVEIDLSGVADGEREEELSRQLVACGRRPFDLTSEPPLRTTLFVLGPHDHVLLVQSHHIALDARAVEILYRELGELYDAARAGRPSRLAELPLTYRDFARRQRRRLTGDWLASELDFWRARLAGAPGLLALPFDRPRPAEQTFEGGMHRSELSPELARSVGDLCRAHGVTPYMLLMAAFGMLIYRVTGESDVLLSGPMANREDPALDNLIGFCANTVVVRVQMGGDPPFTELLARTRDSVLASFEHQEVPLELVVDAVRPDRHPGVNPLVQVNFRVRVGPPPVLELTGAEATNVPVDIGHARFELALELHVLEDRIECEWGYNSRLFDAATIERLDRDFARLLAEAVARPATRLLAFAAMGAMAQAPQPVLTGADIRGLRRRRGVG